MADSLEAVIRSILRGCPLTPGKTHDQDIERFSIRLAEIGSSRKILNQTLVTKKGVQECLGKLRGNARKLISQFDQMPLEALTAMNLLDKYHYLRIIETLLEIAWRAEDGAKINLRSRSNQRRPPNVQAICATLCAARAWHTLTDKKPTPGTKDRSTDERSDFEQFLDEIFAALGISANSEYYARELKQGAWREVIEERLQRSVLEKGS
jgi:hypothetical protein